MLGKNGPAQSAHRCGHGRSAGATRTHASDGPAAGWPGGRASRCGSQLRRIADFPHAGDLIVNSTVFPDGTVAAMEELIGNHGGMGGEQTDAFMLHP